MKKYRVNVNGNEYEPLGGSGDVNTRGTLIRSAILDISESSEIKVTTNESTDNSFSDISLTLLKLNV